MNKNRVTSMHYSSYKSFRIILLYLLSFIFLTGCQSEEIRKAKDFMALEQFENAIILLELETKEDPMNAEAHYLLGLCFFELDKQSKAADYFKKSILIDTDYREEIGSFFYSKAKDQIKKNELNSADKYIEYALEYDPKGKNEFVEDLYEYGIDLFEANIDDSSSFLIFDKIGDLDDNYSLKISELYFTTSEKYFSERDIDNGIKFGELCVTMNSQYQKDIAQLYFTSAKELFDKHINDYLSSDLFNRSTKLDNNKKSLVAEEYINYGKSLILSFDQISEAESYFDNALKFNPSHSNNVAKEYYQLSIKFEEINDVNNYLLYAEKSCRLDSSYNNHYENMLVKGLENTWYRNKYLTDQINNWNNYHNHRDLAGFSNIYAQNVKFYGEDLPKNNCIIIKSDLFKKYTKFVQGIKSVEIEETSQKKYKCSFIKTVFFDNKVRDYPSYLVFSLTNTYATITVESDLITDKNLAKK